MRKITREMRNAFITEEEKRIANDYVCNINGCTYWELHGNSIAKKVNDKTWITTAGWNTMTTRERLSSLAPVCQKKGKLYLKGKEWDGEWICIG